MELFDNEMLSDEGRLSEEEKRALCAEQDLLDLVVSVADRPGPCDRAVLDAVLRGPASTGLATCASKSPLQHHRGLMVPLPRDGSRS